MLKHHLGPERTMETNPSTHPRGYPKNVDNPKQKRSQICKDLHTSKDISFGRETPNWATPIYDNRQAEKEVIYT